MTEDWSCLSQQDTDPYAQVCKEAVENDDKFKSFKKDPRYTAILEHVPYEHGRNYVESIQQYEIDEELIESFKENDNKLDNISNNFDSRLNTTNILKFY